ncbi:hypothetical protein ES703_74328 [subsurface metagenome]
MEAQEFGARIRQLRKQSGMTLRELAEKVNIDFTYLSKIENGAVPPPSDKVISKLAKALNAVKDELLILAGKIPPELVQILKNKETLQRLRAAHAREIARSSSKQRRFTPMIKYLKGLTKIKGLSRITVSIVLVLAIAASLWFTAPARAVNISFPSPPGSGTLGSSLTFTVKVDIENADILPIDHINLEIYNVADASKKATLENLPLGDSPEQSHPIKEGSGSGSARVSATTGAGWGYASGSRYGYGYEYQSGWGYYDLGTGTTYGYGYGYSPFTLATSITYTIKWTPPSASDWEGTYKVKVMVWGDSSQAFTTPTEPSFTLSAEEEEAPAPPPPPEPGVTKVSDYVDENGVFTEEVTAESEDGNVELTIDEGITGLTEDGEPLSEISIIPMEEPPAPPEDSNIISLTYDLGPDKATFDPPITITLTYDPDEIPEGVNEEDLVIAMWDEDAGEWVILEGCIVDTIAHTVTAPLSHFTTFTIIAYTRPAAFTTSTLSISPAEVDIGEEVTISVLVANTGNLTGSYEVTLKIDNVVVDTEEVILAGGDNQTVTFTTSKDVAGSYSVTVDSLSDTFTVKAPPVPPVVPVVPPAPAAFTTGALSISPAEVDIGEEVTISILVTNTGDVTGSYEVSLKIDYMVVATEEVTLAGGASQTVTFTTTKDVAGSYTVTIDSLSGTFEVKEVEVPPFVPPVAPPKPINWWLIGGIIAGVVIIGVVVWIIIQRRRAY